MLNWWLVIFGFLTAVGVSPQHPEDNGLGHCYVSRFLSPTDSFFMENQGFPRLAYPPGSYCHWNFRTLPELRIFIHCEYLNIPMYQPGSCIDFLLLSINGDTANGKRYCGMTGFSLVSPVSHLDVELYSKPWSYGGRFSCMVSAHEPYSPPGEDPCDCGYSSKPRIVGGTETGINEFPFMAGVVDADLRMVVCGGTIISHSAVLTAAHCLNRRIERTAVVVGDHDLNTGSDTDSAKLYKVTEFIVHPQFDDVNSQNDIAIMKTDQRIEYTLKVGPVCLPFTKLGDYIGEKVIALGWGLTEFGGQKSDVLMKVTLDVVNISMCQETFGSKVLPSSQFCTFTQGKDSCQFDSGGPLVRMDPATGRYKLLGIITYGRGCAWHNPSVNTKVASYLDWIQRSLPGVDFCKK